MEWLTRFDRRHRLVLPIAVGVLAAAIGVALLLGAFNDGSNQSTSDGPGETASEPAADKIPTRVVRHREGGFRVKVPKGYAVERNGKSLVLTSQDKSTVVTIGPSGRGSLANSSRELLAAIRDGYGEVRAGTQQPGKVNQRPVLVQAGQARNAADVQLRFVTMVIEAKPSNLAMTTFAAADTSPSHLLPRINTIANSIRALPARNP